MCGGLRLIVRYLSFYVFEWWGFITKKLIKIKLINFMSSVSTQRVLLVLLNSIDMLKYIQNFMRARIRVDYTVDVFFSFVEIAWKNRIQSRKRGRISTLHALRKWTTFYVFVGQ